MSHSRDVQFPAMRGGISVCPMRQ